MIESDDYDLLLKHGGMRRNDGEPKLSVRAAAKELWEEFLEQAGITHE